VSKMILLLYERVERVECIITRPFQGTSEGPKARRLSLLVITNPTSSFYFRSGSEDELSDDRRRHRLACPLVISLS